MLALTPERDVFSPETEVESRNCDECGTTGFYPAHTTGGPPRYCESCERASLIDCLARDRHAEFGRVRALSELSHRDMLPAPDPDHDDDLIVDVTVDSHPDGSFVKSITHIVERECPECGYDRANKSFWRAYTFESGESVRCRACDYVIEEQSTL